TLPCPAAAPPFLSWREGSSPAASFGSARRRRRVERKLAFRQRCEIAGDHLTRHLCERRGLPIRLAVLVDHHGPHAFEEIMAAHEPTGQTILQPHALVEPMSRAF